MQRRCNTLLTLIQREEEGGVEAASAPKANGKSAKVRERVTSLR